MKDRGVHPMEIVPKRLRSLEEESYNNPSICLLQIGSIFALREDVPHEGSVYYFFPSRKEPEELFERIKNREKNVLSGLKSDFHTHSTEIRGEWRRDFRDDEDEYEELKRNDKASEISEMLLKTQK
jgi:hypothetical protein